MSTDQSALPPSDASRHAFFLAQLADSKDRRLSAGDLNRRLKTKAARDFGFTPAVAIQVRDALTADVYVRVEKVGRAVVCVLTEAGVARLEELREFAPVRGGKINPPSNEDVRQARAAYVLLQLLQAGGHTVTAAEANKPTSQSRTLELNTATARFVRRELAGQGFLTITQNGRTERYTLTDAGRLHLGTLAFYDSFRFRLTGRVLNELLEAARDAAKQFTSSEATPTARPGSRMPSSVELEGAVLVSFETLRRERYAVAGLVPIHEVRADVRQRFGPAAAGHEVFDEVVLRLWRSRKVRLTSIADRGRATPEQLQDAIPGVGETLFYLEAVLEPVDV